MGNDIFLMMSIDFPPEIRKSKGRIAIACFVLVALRSPEGKMALHRRIQMALVSKTTKCDATVANNAEIKNLT